MEIHPPHAPIHSRKDFLIQIGTITIGVLIALSFDSVREWRHERALVAEAHERIALEIADNAKEIDGLLSSGETRRKNIDGLIALADDLLASKPRPEVHEINVGASVSELSAASWQTAERIGALGHMDYGDVQRYSRLYTIQELFTNHQLRALEHATSALSSLSGSPFDGPPTAIEAFRVNLRQLRADLIVEEQLATRLREEYRKVSQ